MNLRKKTTLATGLILVALMIALYSITQYLMLNAFDNLQQQDVRKDIGRATNALSIDIATLSSTCQSMAAQNETLQCIENYRNSYFNTNFSNVAFMDKKINFIYLSNAAGETIFKGAYDIGSGQTIPFPESLLNSGLTAGNQKAGIVVLPESPALYSLWPVRTPESGEISGNLVIGRYLDSNYIRSLATAANLYHLNIYKISAAPTETDLQEIAPQLASGEVTPVLYFNNGFVGAYTYCRDISNIPVFIVKVDKPDDIYKAGQNNVRALMLLLLFAGLVFMVTMLLMLDKMVLARLFRLKTEVGGINLDGGGPSQRVTASGKDEFASLANTINLMVDRTERSQQDLKESQTKLMELYEQEQTLRHSLEEEIRKRAAFFRALVHELKTPLTPIIASSESVIDIASENMVVRLGKNILSGALRLNHRVDELLDISRGEMGVLKVSCKPMDIKTVIDQVTNEMRPLMINNQQTLEIELQNSLPPVMGDASRLQQVVMNLMDNAMKFSPKGNVTVRARSEEQKVIVEVEDNGCGVDESELAGIFQPYNRLENNKQYFSGLGLGLAMCKQLVELHGGEIWVTSRKGQGSTFGFSVPTAKETVPIVSNKKVDSVKQE